MHESILQNLKMYLAFDNEDHYVLAKEVKASSDAQWFCTACRCPVKLYNEVAGEDAWFVHNPDETTSVTDGMRLPQHRNQKASLYAKTTINT